MKLSDIRKLCDAATPGPWWDEAMMVESSHVIIADCTKVLADRDLKEALADAKFIAAARTLLPLLLDVAEAARNVDKWHRGPELQAALNALEGV